MLISELAESAHVPTSTVRFYERIGLLHAPRRTAGGYRDYDVDAVNQLSFVHRARVLGLSCEQIAELLPAWESVNCSDARARVGRLIEQKQAELAAQMAELEAASSQLQAVKDELDVSEAPDCCGSDPSCCMPAIQSIYP